MLLNVASRIRCIQKVAYFSFLTCFGGKVEKHDDRRAVDKNTNGKKTKQRQYRQNISLRRKEFYISKVFPYQTVCFGRLTTLPSVAADQLVVSQTPREWCFVMWLRCCCRQFRLVELASKYTPPPGLCSLNAKTYPYLLQKRKKTILGS